MLCTALFAQIQETGELFIIRQTGKLKSAEVGVIAMGGRIIAQLSNNSCEIIKLKPGEYDLTIYIGRGQRNAKSLSVDIQSAETKSRTRSIKRVLV